MCEDSPFPSGFLCFILPPKESTLKSTVGVLGFFPKELKEYQAPISLKLLDFIPALCSEIEKIMTGPM